MRFTLVLLAILGCGATAWADPSPEEARAAYARFTALEGVWRGQSPGNA